MMFRNLARDGTRSMRAGVFVASIIGVLATAYVWRQVERERAIDIDDIDRRARALAHVLSYTVQDSLRGPSEQVAGRLGKRVDGYSRLVGIIVYDAEGRPLAAGDRVRDHFGALAAIVGSLPLTDQEINATTTSEGSRLRVRVERMLREDGSMAGSFVVVHDVAFVDDRARDRLAEGLLVVVMTTLLLVVLISGMTWLVYDLPLTNLADWMRRLRTEDIAETPPPRLPSGPLVRESHQLAASYRAAKTTNVDVARKAVRSDRVWTKERLRDHALDCLGTGNQLVVVSSREPYMHVSRDGAARVISPPGGLVTALDPVLRACGGTWVAHGTGDMDRETADADGRLTVPPGQSRYTLRRIWLSPDESDAYYSCCNDAIWPMCLMAHDRPVFRTSDWERYVAVNRRFAEATLDEIVGGDAVVLVQDYQMALVPRMIRKARPDIRVALFWHVPWPSAEAVRICPWHKEIIHGMLGADTIGFHLQQYCNNFMDSLERLVEARTDRDHGAVEMNGRTTRIRPQPISVQPWSERGMATGAALQVKLDVLRREHGLEGVDVAVGVDRVDSTKGLPERLRAFAHFLQKYPEYRGRVSLVQLAAPSRMHLARYRAHLEEIVTQSESINREFGTGNWKPVHLFVDQHDAQTVHAFLSMASMAIVSSLHDGMNLVAKEYILAKESGDGCLVLSEFAGAAQQLTDALVINPYDTERFADAIRDAAAMPSAERQARMARLRRQVEENNIYRWAADVMADIPQSAGRWRLDSLRPHRGRVARGKN